MYNIHLLPASYGDSILIEYGTSSSKFILIDGGPSDNFDELVAGLKRVAPKLKTLELLVLTHIDIDHLDGIITMLNRDKLPFKIKEVWFNGCEQIIHFGDTLGVLQGEYISSLIGQKKLMQNKHFKGNAVYVSDYAKLPVINFGGMSLTLLSPGDAALEKLYTTWIKEIKKFGDNTDFLKKLGKDKRYASVTDILGEPTIEQLQNTHVSGDTSVPNGSSIAFIATFEGKSCLFAGDATSDYLLKAINPLIEKSGKERLKVDAWKLGHHGSKRSTLEKLMEKIDCKKILLSSNGKKFKHPDKETIAKLLKNNGPNIQLYFNYKTIFNEKWDDRSLQQKYKYKVNYPKNEGIPGITLKLK